MGLILKRAYEPVSPSDGRRYLVDRLWPRGRTAESLGLAAWRKELAPSEGLRRWYGHSPRRFAEFRRRYRAQLRDHERELALLAEEAKSGPVTLVFAAKDPETSNAEVLAERLAELGAPRTRAP